VRKRSQPEESVKTDIVVS